MCMIRTHTLPFAIFDNLLLKKEKCTQNMFDKKVLATYNTNTYKTYVNSMKWKEGTYMIKCAKIKLNNICGDYLVCCCSC